MLHSRSSASAELSPSTSGSHVQRPRRHLRRTLLALSLGWILAACSTPSPSSAITVYVSPQGSDATGTGSVAAPYRTLSFAVTRAPAASTVMLAAGDYAAGETFPIDVSGRIVIGAGPGVTRLIGNSAVEGALSATSGETTVRDLTLDRFGTASGGAAIRMDGGTLTVDRVHMIDGPFMGYHQLDGTATLRSVFIARHQADNVRILSGSVSILDSEIEASPGADGIDVEGGVLVLRRTDVVDNVGSGIEVDGGTVDLGTAADPGGNFFTGNGDFQLQDDRSEGAPTIAAYGNTWPQIISGVKTGPDAYLDIWQIVATGNHVDFGDP